MCCVSVSVGLVWDSDHPNMETTTEVAAAIGTSILLQDVSMLIYVVFLWLTVLF